MKCDIKDINKTVKEQNLQEVKTSIIFQNSNIPHPEGLASYEIFGQPGTYERQVKRGYIDLGTKFIHPQVYRILISLKRELYKNIVNGEGEYTIEDGEVIPVVPGKPTPPGVKTGTGIKWLYDNWEKINFKPKPGGAMTTNLRRETVSLLDKDIIFIDKWIVMPAFYRDVDLQTNKRNEYNVIYAKLIQLASSVKMMKNLNNLGIVSEAEKAIQNTLLELYKMIILFLCGSHGFINENILGKTTIYSSRLVISAGSYNFSNPEMSETDHNHVGIPLTAVCKIFFPFILYGLNDFFFNRLKGEKFIYVFNPKNLEVIEKKEIHPSALEIINPANIEKRIELYQDSPYHRLEPITIRTIDDQYYPLIFLTKDGNMVYSTNLNLDKLKQNLDENGKLKLIPLTWMHLFYMVAEKYVGDKHVYITRYPIEDYLSIYPALMNILPAINYKTITIENQVYKRFPIFPNKSRDEMTETELDQIFVETLKLHTTYLESLKADHDGDMVNCQGVYSDEANEDARKFRTSVANIIGLAGNCIRLEKDVLEHALYVLTYKYDYKDYEKEVINY